MSSSIGVQNIAHTNGTNAMTIASDGSVNMTGHVLQVVQNTSTSQHSGTATDWASTGFSVTITPKATSSKILLNINASVTASANAVQPRFSIFRGTTNLGETGRGFGQIYIASGGLNQSHVSTSFLDSPNTTNATTYTVYMRTNTGTYYWGSDGGTQTFIAQEIGG